MILAARAALRVLPYFRDLRLPQRDINHLRDSTLCLFRATALAWVAAKHPSRAKGFGPSGRVESAAYAAAAGHNDDDAAHAASYAAWAAPGGVSAAKDAAHAAVAAERAAARAPADVTGTAVAAGLWATISADAAFLRGAGGSSQSLVDQPSWPKKAPPAWAHKAWAALLHALPKDEDWDVWIDWYEARLEGRSDPEEVELVYATVPPEKWNEGPAAANAWIREKLRALQDNLAPTEAESQRPAPPLPELRSPEELKAWLQTQTREVAVVIASRLALRVLPGFSGHARYEANRQLFAKHSAALFRATALSHIAATFPARANQFMDSALAAGHFAAAANEAAAAHATAAINVSTAANAANAVAKAVNVTTSFDYAPAFAALAAASATACYTTDKNAAHQKMIWAEIRADAFAILTGSTTIEPADSHLWLSGEAPSWERIDWASFKRTLPEDQDWDVWFAWYEAPLEGRADRDEIELIYAEVPQPKWDEGPAAANAWIKAELARRLEEWDEGPAAANAWIKAELERLEKEPTPSWAATLSMAQPPTVSVHWISAWQLSSHSPCRRAI